MVRDKATKRAVVIRTLGQHGFDSGSTAAEKLGALEDVTAAGDLDGDGLLSTFEIRGAIAPADKPKLVPGMYVESELE